jgi:hypothetical protein
MLSERVATIHPDPSGLSRPVTAGKPDVDRSITMAFSEASRPVIGSRDPLFDSAWFKWVGAIVHAQTLQADVDARRRDGDADPVRAFRTEYHSKRHGFAVIVDEVAPMSLRWCLLVGDIANNYRAAVDHLAWALVSRGRTPPGTGKLRQENLVAFPICEKRSEFRGALRKKLPGVRRADQAKVRRRQPYQYGARTRNRHALALLASINNADKHRTIQPLWSFPTRVDIKVTHVRDCVLRPIRFRRRAEHVQVGTELAFIGARKVGPNPEIEVQLNVTAEPTTDQSISIREWSDRCGILIFQLLREFSDQPPGIDEVGAILAHVPRS